MDLKAETIGLAVVLELPMIVVDVQRAGPSTGMPTKTEQSDLLMALYGRHGESPMPVIAPSTPGGCFDAAFEAARIAVRYRTPVILLSDTFLASSSEPWRIPSIGGLPEIDPAFAVAPDGEAFLPYARNERSRGRGRSRAPRASPHRIGGLEKADRTGNISYDAANHERMTELRAAKVDGIAVNPAAARRCRTRGEAAGARLGLERGRDPRRRATGARAGHTVACAHVRHLNPLPRTWATCCVVRSRARAETNSGQLAQVLRARYLVDVESYTKVQGLPLFTGEIGAAIVERIPCVTPARCGAPATS